MDLTLKPQEGSLQRKTRRGCGHGSGLGKTCGKGNKGQRARKGQKRPYVGFEGGQMPLYRRVPKRGFTHESLAYELVNIDVLNQFDEASLVNEESLLQKGFVKKAGNKIKILGRGELTKKLTIEAHLFSASAKEKIEKIGGTVKIIEG
ncbi:MAG TPA: 50S ribosomal protein L15 [Spirochaetia bacterium]|nr:MAG: 50S ribosomal protein L15 [Spirochaetes bacterium GWB1_36_13]HCL57321.1 50S ribosomal protein L15 [Spirochaetia bacterium]